MLLTMKEQQRVEAIQALMGDRLSAAQTAQVLGRSERQVWRLLARAGEDGLPGLLHGNRGREPADKSDDRLRQRVLKSAEEEYQGVNDRHLQELLAREHGIRVCRESLRKRLRAAGLAPKRTRRSRKYRSPRQRPAASDMLFSKAYSPQAKGRIERLWGVLQDRLVVELRLASVSTLAGANALLKRYLPSHNCKSSELLLNGQAE